MIAKPKIYIVLIFSIIVSNIYCQTDIPTNKLSNTMSHLGGGFVDALEWYDIPIGIAYFSAKYINEQKYGNAFSVPPASFDENLSSALSINGSQSFGSIDKSYFPNIIFLGRLAVTTSLGLFSDHQISNNSFRNIFLFKKALIYTYTITEYTKTFIKRERPDGSDTRSFFSGHTSTTFATSTYLFLELNQFFNSWSTTKNNNSLKNIYKVSSFTLLYGWASYVGYSRIRDNKHYLSDVLLGAAIGTLTSYFVFNLYHSENDTVVQNFSLSPGLNKSLNLSFNLKF